MGKLTTEIFNESCCDGGEVCGDSAQPCGCDPKAKWVCERHREDKKVASNYEIRKFDTGATRDTAEGKHDFEGFLSPLVIKRFGEYMTKHRVQPDGQLRDSDNWQLGIPQKAYMKSGWRHFFDWWTQHRGYPGQDTLEESLCALMFNTMGYLHEVLKGKS